MIKHFSGKKLLDFYNGQEISSKLGFFTLEYFFTIHKERNYLLLFKDNLIIGQISYLKKRNDFLLLSVSITSNHKNNGYSKLLLNEYFKLINPNNNFLITDFSEEGEKFIAEHIFQFTEDENISLQIVKENEF